VDDEINSIYVKKLTNSLINCLNLNFTKEIHYFYNSGLIIFLGTDALVSYAVTRSNDKILKFLCETKIPKPLSLYLEKKFHYLFCMDMLINKNKTFYKCLYSNKFEFADRILKLGAKIHFENDFCIRYACTNKREEIIKYLLGTGEFDESNIYRNIFYSIRTDKYISAKTLFTSLFNFYILLVSHPGYITSVKDNFNQMDDAYISHIKPGSLIELRLLRKKIIIKAFQLYVLLSFVTSNCLNFSTYLYLKNECLHLFLDTFSILLDINRKRPTSRKNIKKAKVKSKKLSKRRLELIQLMGNSNYWKELEVPPLIKLIYITLENP
jgi:hypothetical protein